jgi:hypothetical protein
MLRWSLIGIVFLAVGCRGVSVYPFANPRVEEPKFPDDYGVMVKWQTRF